MNDDGGGSRSSGAGTNRESPDVGAKPERTVAIPKRREHFVVRQSIGVGVASHDVTAVRVDLFDAVCRAKVESPAAIQCEAVHVANDAAPKHGCRTRL